LACKKGESDLTAYLLEKGANPNVQDKDGNTCLHILSKLTNEGVEHDDILDQCLTYGGDLEIKNNSSFLFLNRMTTNTKFERRYMEHKFDITEDVTGGDVEIGFSWSNLNDLDVHCHCVCKSHIHYSSKKCHNCRGFLDFDMNVSVSNDPKASSNSPVEHIFWPFIVPGVYSIEANYYRNHPGIEKVSEYLVTISVKGQCLFEKKGKLTFEKETQFVCSFEFDKEKNFKILDEKIRTVNEKNDVLRQTRDTNQQNYQDLSLD